MILVHYLVSDGWQQSVEACCQEHASCEGVTQRQRSPVSVCFVVVGQQQAHRDQDTRQHEAKQSQQAKQLGHQDLHPSAQTLQHHQTEHLPPAAGTSLLVTSGQNETLSVRR